MKILHCLHQYHPARGGAEWLMKNVSERLRAAGHEVRVISTNAWSMEDYSVRGCGKSRMRAGEETIGGVPVRRVPFTRAGAAFFRAARASANRVPLPFGNRVRMRSWGPRSRAYLREILRSVREEGADIIAASPLPALNVYYAWKAARRENVPFVMIPCFHTEDRWTYCNPLYFEMMRQAAAVICLTEWEKRFLEEKTGTPAGVFHALGAGIDMENDRAESGERVSASAVREKYGIAERDVILFLGQHAPHKGILPLIEAMRSVWSEKPETALVIAGNPTAYTHTIEARIRRLKEGERRRVRLIGKFPDSEKRSIMAACRIFVSVSAFESFGIVFLEAWREKKPVIGCRRGASSRIIEDLRDGLLVPDGDSGALAGAILELLEEGPQAGLMGEAGYQKAVSYTWDNIIERWEKVYENAVRG